jgi:hypothetical protein
VVFVCWVYVWCLDGDAAVHSEATLDRPEAMTLEAFGSFRGRASRNIHMLVQPTRDMVTDTIELDIAMIMDGAYVS